MKCKCNGDGYYTIPGTPAYRGSGYGGPQIITCSCKAAVLRKVKDAEEKLKRLRQKLDDAPESMKQ